MNAVLNSPSATQARPGEVPTAGTLSAAAAAANAAAASFAALTDSLDYLDATSIEQVRQAYRFADEAHLGQLRNSGEPYITHPIAVAAQCATWKLDAQALMAALLHDAMEDCGVTKADLIDRFGAPVAELVDGLTKLDKLQFNTREENQAESFRKMLLAMARDVRVILIKLADRTHNMRTLSDMPRSKWGRISSETLEIYAPIALRHAVQGSQQITQPQARSGAKGSGRGGHRLLQDRYEGPPRRPRENAVRHLPEDGPQAPEFCPGHRYLRIQGDRTHGDRLLHRLGRAPPDVQAGSWQVQGPHRHRQAQWLPIPAHHLGGPFRREHRIPDAYGRDACHRRGWCGRALVVQGAGRRWHIGRATRDQVAAVPAGHPERDPRCRRVLGPCQGGPVPGRCLRFHPQEPDHGPASRSYRGGLCLRHPQQRWRPHHGGKNQQ